MPIDWKQDEYVEQNLLCPLINFCYPLTEPAYFFFYNLVFNSKVKPVFKISTPFGNFKVDRKKRMFYILERKYKDGYESSKEETDYGIIVMYKSAIRAGFKVFLEPKFSN